MNIFNSKIYTKAILANLKFMYKTKTTYPTVYKGVILINPEILKLSYFKENNDNLIISVVDNNFFVDSEDQTVSCLYKINNNGSISSP